MSSSACRHQWRCECAPKGGRSCSVTTEGIPEREGHAARVRRRFDSECDGRQHDRVRCRDLRGSDVPLVLLQHFRGNLDNWDPAIVDALAAARRVVAFDNVGVGATTGRTPSTVEAISRELAQGLAAAVMCWAPHRHGYMEAAELACARNHVVDRRPPRRFVNALRSPGTVVSGSRECAVAADRPAVLVPLHGRWLSSSTSRRSVSYWRRSADLGFTPVTGATHSGGASAEGRRLWQHRQRRVARRRVPACPSAPTVRRACAGGCLDIDRRRDGCHSAVRVCHG